MSSFTILAFGGAMGKTLYIKEGDELPNLEIQLLDDNDEPLVIDDLGIKLVVAPCVGGRRIVDEEDMTPVGANPQIGDDIGKATYEWGSGETSLPGEYLIEVILITTEGEFPNITTKRMTIPGNDYGKLIIVPHL